MASSGDPLRGLQVFADVCAAAGDSGSEFRNAGAGTRVTQACIVPRPMDVVSLAPQPLETFVARARAALTSVLLPRRCNVVFDAVTRVLGARVK